MLSSIRKKPIRYLYISYNSNKKVNTKSLQVPCSPLLSTLLAYLPGKRVPPFTSVRKLRASMTVEAAIVLPLFMLASVTLLTPMRMLDCQRKLQTVVESTCEKMSLYAYMMEFKGNSDLKEDNEAEQLFTNIGSGVWLKTKLSEYSGNTHIASVQTPDEDGNMVLEIVYKEKSPFFSEILPEITLDIAACRHSWRGIRGKLRKEPDEYKDEIEEVLPEEMVYVGKYMGRYHRKRECHYIYNDYQAVSIEEAKNMRNKDGDKYSECATCKKHMLTKGVVYITPVGRHYHVKTDCMAMISYVRKVPLSEVEYLGPCSYCSK